MTGKIIQFTGTLKRYPPHVHMIENLKRDREESKARVQEMADECRKDLWRGDKIANAQIMVDRILFHPLGGKEFVLNCLERLKKYVESRGF